MSIMWQTGSWRPVSYFRNRSTTCNICFMTKTVRNNDVLMDFAYTLIDWFWFYTVLAIFQPCYGDRVKNIVFGFESLGFPDSPQCAYSFSNIRKTIFCVPRELWTLTSFSVPSDGLKQVKIQTSKNIHIKSVYVHTYITVNIYNIQSLLYKSHSFKYLKIINGVKCC
jgi:hypothetical protein